MPKHRRKRTRWKNAWDMQNYQRISGISERMTKTTMRKIVFPPGTRASTRPRVSALAWATNRRGRNVWASDNVTTQISEYLAQNGYQLSTHDIAYAIKWCVDHQYAFAEKHAGGKRTVRFGFVKDVDLNGHEPTGVPRMGETPMSRAISATNSTGMHAVHAVAASATTPTNGIAPQTEEAGTVMTATPPPAPQPTPPTSKPTVDLAMPVATAPYRLHELDRWLTRYAEANPEAYAEYVDRAIDQLSAALG